MTPTCSQPRHDTLSKGLRRVRIKHVFSEPPAEDLSETVIARLSLPLTGQRIARRSSNAKSHERRAPLHPKDITGALARFALNAAAYAVIFLFVYIALSIRGTP